MLAAAGDELLDAIFMINKKNKPPNVLMAAIIGELVREEKNKPIEAIEHISKNKPIIEDMTCPQSRWVPNDKDKGIKLIINRINK